MVRERHPATLGAIVLTHCGPISRGPRRAVSLLAIGLATGLATLATIGCASKPSTPSTTIQEIDRSRQRAYDLALKAQQLSKDGKTDEAIAALREAVSLWRDMPAAWNNLGVLLMQQQNYAEAVSAFKVAAEQSQGDPRPLENIGVCYMSSGWAEDSLRYFVMALRRDPNRIESLRGAVRAAEMLRIRDDATYERIRTALMIETDPQYRMYFERQQQLVKAALALRTP